MARPLDWKDPEEFEEEAHDYFDFCVENDEIPDIEGFAVYCDTTRKTLLDYEKKEEFSYTIKRIKEKIFHKKKQLAMKGKMNPAIFIFDAKNNHEYTDKQEYDHTTAGERINIPPIVWANGSSGESKNQ